MRPPATLVLLAMVLLGACSSSTHASASMPTIRASTVSASAAAHGAGLITGRLRTVGGPAPGAGGAVTGTVTAIAVGGRAAGRTSTDGDGRFRLQLPAGSYRLSGRSPTYGGGAGVCLGMTSVLVTTATAATVDVLCQVK